jgi:hypothetical protein
LDVVGLGVAILSEVWEGGEVVGRLGDCDVVVGVEVGVGVGIIGVDVIVAGAFPITRKAYQSVFSCLNSKAKAKACNEDGGNDY